MKIKIPHFTTKDKIIITGTIAFFIGINYWAYYTTNLYTELKDTRSEFAVSTSTLNTTIKELEEKLADSKKENENLSDVLSDEQKKTVELERERRRNEKKINTLTKLTTIDPELLKKYSKVYFLSENYVPAKLDTIGTNFLVDPTKDIQILDGVSSYLIDMLEDAKRAGVDLKVLSGYRSFDYQKTLKSQYKVVYGAGTANQFSAEQGYSEHQLGTAVDFTTTALRSAETTFDQTAAYAWLAKNAYKYGFIISYPKGNLYYQYEPWHWRFVGVDLAEDMHDDGKQFYELDQRDIDEYLVKFFD
ncbi:MAG: VanY protein [Patescibacteria group bacterium]|nr:VanY protein [Patescibacteria group bacterium]